MVSNAGWYPSYDIRVDDIKNPVAIVYKANVFQNSGVEWKDVKLSFSNATPWVAGDIPVLNPWFVDFYYTQPRIMLRGNTSLAKRSDAPVMKEMIVQVIWRWKKKPWKLPRYLFKNRSVRQLSHSISQFLTQSIRWKSPDSGNPKINSIC